MPPKAFNMNRSSNEAARRDAVYNRAQNPHTNGQTMNSEVNLRSKPVKSAVKNTKGGRRVKTRRRKSKKRVKKYKSKKRRA